MDHIAIMKKSWGLLPKILTGEKKIESRWYKSKHVPWDRIKKGDIVYFKNSGEPVTVNAKVSKVVQFSDLNPLRVRQILNQYGADDGINRKDLLRFSKMFREKKYCLLIFLAGAKSIEPFNIDKSGYGAMAAWITTESVEDVRIHFIDSNR